ncbi:MAG: hypothetical protein Q8O29_05080 [Polaromonas sp.]|uniref:hypothetical protein n=1 Tax=Polaromonas sp. TaxID=1869339 RepID=UPI0027327D56|nr:hypothetical protein [Polaromonas sp.]MDP2817644.1 hypothetical protein [Polaromonas sp.]
MTARDLQQAPAAAPARTPQEVLSEEAARYALLRRVAPALRHHLAGTLQPIGMVAAIMDRRLQAAQPDLTAIRESSKSISTLTRSAAGASMGLLTWLAPKESSVGPLHASVEECLGMLTTDLAFRGFSVSNTIATSDMAASVFALRSVFTAALIALTDAALTPARIVISSHATDGQLGVVISVSSEPGAVAAEDPPSYRKLGWDDVQALATAEQVGLSHEAGRAEMHFMAAENADVTV